MTKIYAYSIRPDEEPALKEWQAQHPEVTVAYTDTALTATSADLAAGADAVVGLQTTEYTRAAIEKLATNGTRYLSIRNVGTDNIHRDVLREFGFKLSNVPVYSPNAIAEHAVIQLSRLVRRTKVMDNKVASRDLRWSPTIGREVRTITVGVIGTGNTGKVAIQILQGFGAKVIAYNRSHDPELAAQGIYVDSLDELYAQADAITLHIPGGPSTYHMLDADTFAKMKDGVVIVNCARGSVIDTTALVAALDSGKVGAAALDVYENENDVFYQDWRDKEFPDTVLNDLIDRENVLITPHAAFYTTKAVSEMVQQSMDNALTFINGGQPESEIEC